MRTSCFEVCDSSCRLKRVRLHSHSTCAQELPLRAATHSREVRGLDRSLPRASFSRVLLLLGASNDGQPVDGLKLAVAWARSEADCSRSAPDFAKQHADGMARLTWLGRSCTTLEHLTEYKREVGEDATGSTRRIQPRQQRWSRGAASGLEATVRPRQERSCWRSASASGRTEPRELARQASDTSASPNSDAQDSLESVTDEPQMWQISEEVGGRSQRRKRGASWLPMELDMQLRSTDLRDEAGWARSRSSRERLRPIDGCALLCEQRRG
jgi:hypothetical protein